MLDKAGYKDIRVAPTSFVVHAKDTDGNPVVMSVSPDSFTEVTDLNNNGRHHRFRRQRQCRDIRFASFRCRTTTT